MRLSTLNYGQPDEIVQLTNKNKGLGNIEESEQELSEISKPERQSMLEKQLAGSDLDGKHALELLFQLSVSLNLSH